MLLILLEAVPNEQVVKQQDMWFSYKTFIVILMNKQHYLKIRSSFLLIELFQIVFS
jgi:hypothetical protein